MKIRLEQYLSLNTLIDSLADGYLFEAERDGALYTPSQLRLQYNRQRKRMVLITWFEFPRETGVIATVDWGEKERTQAESALAFRLIDLLTLESIESWLLQKDEQGIVGSSVRGLNVDTVLVYLRDMTKGEFLSPSFLEESSRAEWLLVYRWLLRAVTSTSEASISIRAITAHRVLRQVIALREAWQHAQQSPIS